MKTATPTKYYNEFKDFIIKQKHPCIMAQTVFKMEDVTLRSFNEFGSSETAKKIIEELKLYIDTYDSDSNSFQTFIAVFPNEKEMSEIEFENKLWKQLNAIHAVDIKPWDSEVDDDPTSSKFSFSIHGTAFYIVGMHPKSSRKARQAPYATLVFNLHHQFEKLREMGTYEQVRNRIRKRDKKLQGSINPVLTDFGDASEAMQYSGRNVNEDWKCPFQHLHSMDNSSQSHIKNESTSRKLSSDLVKLKNVS